MDDAPLSAVNIWTAWRASSVENPPLPRARWQLLGCVDAYGSLGGCAVGRGGRLLTI